MASSAALKVFTATPVAAVPGLVAGARAAFDTNKTRPLAWRKQQLGAVARMIDENRKAINAALAADLRKPELEALTAEILPVLSDVKHHLAHLDEWSAVRAVPTPGFLLPGSSFVQPEPLGVVLIIGAWNYPLQLVFQVLVAAIAAGNAAVIKPSEVSAHSAFIIQDLVSRYLDTEAIRIVQGGVEETTAVLRERFDHILYTGNGAVGRVVMRAAAEHLTPVTLELGGKSPVYVDKDANLDLAAHRIIWGKVMNAGQTCIAPDYALVHHDVKDAFVARCKAVLVEFLGADPRASASYARIVNRRHFDRVSALVASGGGKVDTGSSSAPDAADLFYPPTLVIEPSRTSALMTEEIFGPILPILGVSGAEEAVQFIVARPKPLSLYVFSSSSATQRRLIAGTSSGGVTVNDVIVHCTNPELKFGGIGPSGTGAYHGKFGFDTFTHFKPVFHQTTLLDLIKVRYAPYTPEKTAQVAFLLQNVPDLPRPGWRDLVIFGLLGTVAVLAARVGGAF